MSLLFVKLRRPWSALDAWGYSTVIAGMVGEACRPWIERLAPEGDGLVIDVGCGAGDLTRVLAERHPRCTVLGLDRQRATVRRAARRHGAAAPGMRFAVGDAMALPVPDGSACLAVSVASIKHWPDPLRGVRELNRVLRPGAPVAVLEVDRDCSPAAARRFVAGWRWLVPGLRAPAAAYFREVVAGQSFALGRLTEIVREGGFVELTGERHDTLPFVMVRGRRPSA